MNISKLTNAHFSKKNSSTLLGYIRKTAQAALLMGLSIQILQASGLYEGERNSFGRFDGQGTYTNSRGDTYRGQWRDGVKFGIGTLTKNNGEIYKGDWQENKRNGKGEQSFKNGDVYKGQWVFNKRHGLGTYFYTNGNVYEGNFQSNQIHQNGLMKYANGDQFQGLWSYGKKDGSGTYHFKNGDQLKGQWTKEKFSGKGQFLFSNGLIYDGPIANLKPNGVGLCNNTKSKPSAGKKTINCHFKSGTQINIAKAKKVAPIQAKPKIIRVASQAAPKIAALPKPVSFTPPQKPEAATKPIIKAIKPNPVSSKATLLKVPKTTVTAKPSKPKKSASYKARKPEFGFNHNWQGAPKSEQAPKVWQEETASYKNQLRIKSEGTDYSISIRIQDYDGPGIYPIGYYDVRVNNSSKSLYASHQESSGKIHITQDNQGFISGTFSLDVFPNGNPNLDDTIELRDGFFTIAKNSP